MFYPLFMYSAISSGLNISGPDAGMFASLFLFLCAGILVYTVCRRLTAPKRPAAVHAFARYLLFLPVVLFSALYCLVLKTQLFVISYWLFTKNVILTVLEKLPTDFYASIVLLPYHLLKFWGFDMDLYDLPKTLQFFFLISFCMILLTRIREFPGYLLLMVYLNLFLIYPLLIDGNPILLTFIFLISMYLSISEQASWTDILLLLIMTASFDLQLFLIFFIYCAGYMIKIRFENALQVHQKKVSGLILAALIISLVFRSGMLQSVSRTIFILFWAYAVACILSRNYLILLHLVLYTNAGPFYGYQEQFVLFQLLYPSIPAFLMTFRNPKKSVASITFVISILILSSQYATLHRQFDYFITQRKNFLKAYPLCFSEARRLLPENASVLTNMNDSFYRDKSYLPWVRLYPGFYQLPRRKNFYILCRPGKNPPVTQMETLYSSPHLKVHKVR